MEFIGFACAVLIGLSLGLIGGGGSILTVPVLVYLLGVNPVLSTAYSLFVVGAASAFGSITNARQGNIDYKKGILFAIPSIVAVYLTRAFLLPSIPNQLFVGTAMEVSKATGLMLFFALIMVIAAYSMIRAKKRTTPPSESGRRQVYLIFIEGAVVGVLTGIVGAGGGFLIIPALVLFAKLPMKIAVGTSLFIITLKSLIGFLGDVSIGRNLDWQFLLIFTGLAIFGILIGNYLAQRISGQKLKKGFGYFVLIMAVIIIVQELL